MSCIKVKYADEKTALFHLEKLKKTSVRNEHLPERAYLCEYCNCWHLTSKINLLKPKTLTDYDEKIKKLNNQVTQRDNEIKNLKKKVAKLEKLLYDSSRKKFETK